MTIAEWLAHPRMRGLELLLQRRNPLPWSVPSDPWCARIHYCAPDGVGSYYTIGRGDTPDDAVSDAFALATQDPMGFGGSL
jgi:hypothetical protein